MAGLVAKSFGMLFLVPGIVLSLAGLAAAFAGWSEANDALASPSEGDEERAEANAKLVVGGLATIAIGILATTGGAILVVVGRGQERRALAAVSQPSVQPQASGSGQQSPAPPSPTKRKAASSGRAKAAR